jgi:hypothetical protein
VSAASPSVTPSASSESNVRSSRVKPRVDLTPLPGRLDAREVVGLLAPAAFERSLGSGKQARAVIRVAGD